MRHTLPAPCVAVSVLESSCGEISFTGIETSEAPTPPTLKSVWVRLECSDEPGDRGDPSARRSAQAAPPAAPVAREARRPPTLKSVWVGVECGDEPGYRWDPSARRSAQSITHVVPLAWWM